MEGVGVSGRNMKNIVTRSMIIYTENRKISNLWMEFLISTISFFIVSKRTWR